MNTMKKELLNDVLTGLLIAATFAAVAPDLAHAAGDFQGASSAAESTIAKPFVTVISYIAYGLGTAFGIVGIAGAKKHADNPASNPLGPAIGKLGAGAALIAAPSLIGVLQGTGNGTLVGSSTFGNIGF